MSIFYHSLRWQTLNHILPHLIYQQRKEKKNATRQAPPHAAGQGRREAGKHEAE